MEKFNVLKSVRYEEGYSNTCIISQILVSFIKIILKIHLILISCDKLVFFDIFPELCKCPC